MRGGRGGKINTRGGSKSRGKEQPFKPNPNRLNPIKQMQDGEGRVKVKLPTKNKKPIKSERGKNGELEDVDDITIKEYKSSEENTLKRLRSHVYEGGDEFDNYDILDDSNTVFSYAADDISSLEILGPDDQHLNTHRIKRTKQTDQEEEQEEDQLLQKGKKNKLSRKEQAKKRLQAKMDLAKSIHFARLPPVQRRFWKDTVRTPKEEQLALRKRLKVKIESTRTSELMGGLVKNNRKGVGIPRPIVSMTDPDIPKSMKTFLDLIMRKYPAIREPTPVQTQAWSAVLTGNDVLTIAQTGSGKTLGYLLPAIPHILAQMRQRSALQIKGMAPIRGPIALVIVPTRELAQQVEAVCKPMKSRLGIHSLAIYGGIKSAEQKEILSQEHNEIVIATPGRLVDLIQRSEQVIGMLSRVSLLIFDEADRMLTLGFGDQLQKISEQIRPDRQTLMFSATFAKNMQEASTKWLKDPFKIRVKSSSANDENTAVITKNVKQVVKVLPEQSRQEYLFKFLQSIIDKEQGMRNRSLILIFVNQIRNVKPLATAIDKFLSKQTRKYKCGAIHGDLKQNERDRVVNEFKAGIMTVLVATDILGRGIHINNLRFVINYDFPTSLEQYIHRVGRTGRQGNKGHSLTLYCDIPQNQTFAKGLVKILEECEQQVDPQLRKLADSYFGESEEIPSLKTEEPEQDESSDDEDDQEEEVKVKLEKEIDQDESDTDLSKQFNWKSMGESDNEDDEESEVVHPDEFADEYVTDSDDDDESSFLNNQDDEQFQKSLEM